MVRRAGIVAWMLCMLLTAAWAQHVDGWDEAAEQRMAQLINQERSRRGLAELSFDERLRNAAREHTIYLARNDGLEHQFRGEQSLPSRLMASGLRFDASGENLALDSDGADSAHIGLMHSPPHRANILRDTYSAIGVGALWRGGVLYVTEDFARTVVEVSEDEVEDAVIRGINQQRRAAGATSVPRRIERRMHETACGMARSDRLNTRLPYSLPNASVVLAFTMFDVRKLPEELGALRSSSVSAVSVSACYSTSTSYSIPVFWVLVVTYR